MLLVTACEQLLERLRDTPFILTLSGRREQPVPDGGAMALLSLPEVPRKIVLRTIHLHDRPHVQLNAYTRKQHFTKNLPADGTDFAAMLPVLLTEPFTQAHAQTPEGDLYVRIVSKGGTDTLSTRSTPPSRQGWEEQPQHDSDKNYLLTPGNAATLLRALGIAAENGGIRAPMQAKYRQINHFLSIATQLDVVRDSDELRIVDCGCGKAYLSLALYHVLTMMGKRVELTGIDTNRQVIDFCNRTAAALHYDHARFFCTPIAGFQTDGPVDIVIALHACDTATDDALALALRLRARAVLAAPCCHHYANARLRTSSAPDDAALLLQDGITRERLADLLTDSMRRDILKAYGYSASLIEFVAPEHTTKNILIRAEHPVRPASPDDVRLQRVRDDIQRWNAGPKLVELIDADTARPAPADIEKPA